MATLSYITFAYISLINLTCSSLNNYNNNNNNNNNNNKNNVDDDDDDNDDDDANYREEKKANKGCFLASLGNLLLPRANQ